MYFMHILLRNDRGKLLLILYFCWGRRGRDCMVCVKVCQWLATDRWFSSGPPPTDRHDKTEILLKVALNAIKQTNIQTHKLYFYISVKYYILELKLIISDTLKSGRNLSVSIGVVLELNVGVLL